MPRLLLVDDNPSIHKIAETLLAASDVQLVSCGSGAQAMALVDQGDRFDVALLDISMMGMDGWTLLQRLRETEATALLPVAMMAGVLDIVDPEKLRLAPIQGFLKKPVELRDLGDRVRRLLETPVLPPPPPPVLAAPEPVAAPPAEAPAPVEESDLLQLGPEDLLPETAEAPPEPEAELPPGPAYAEPLDLEELDLEGLRNLDQPAAVSPEQANAPTAPLDEPAPAKDGILTVPEFLLSDTLPETGPETPEARRPSEDLDALDAFDALDASELHFEDDGSPLTGELPDLGPMTDLPPGLGGDDPFDWSDESDSLVDLALGGQESRPAPEDAITLSDILDPGTGPAAAEPAPEPASGPDPVAALLADPAAMDRLVQALVARMGDQVLREIAWEIMPELADRLHRQETP